MFIRDNEEITLSKLNKIMLENGVRWNDLFESEERLIDTLLDLELSEDYSNGIIAKIQKWLKSGKPLTPKQLTQLKRNSKMIYRLYYNE